MSSFFLNGIAHNDMRLPVIGGRQRAFADYSVHSAFVPLFNRKLRRTAKYKKQSWMKNFRNDK